MQTVTVAAAAVTRRAERLVAELARARRAVLPGGVNSPVRAFARRRRRRRRSSPARRGAHLVDEDGVEYVRLHPRLRAAHPRPRPPRGGRGAERAARARGTAFGATSALEVELAERIVAAMPVGRDGALRQLRHRGDDVGAAPGPRGHRARPGRQVRRARYHGHADAFLAAAGSGVATLGIPGSPGRARRPPWPTPSWCPYNDAAAVAAVLDREGERVAAVIVEPVAGNMGCVPPLPGYLAGAARADRAARRAAHLRRGDDRLPGGPRRRPGAVRGQRPTSPASAR